jgi:hypothetical protein
MTVGQLVGEFGYDNVSTNVQNKWDNNDLDNWVNVRHLIEPNDDRIESFEDYQNMPYKSLYWEQSNDDEKFLSKRGLRTFRVIAPRWELVKSDQTYGYAPGWYALGNVKQLQKTVKDKLIAQEKLHNPPMSADASVEHTNLLPGGVTRTSATTPNSGVRPAYQINPNLESFLQMENHLKDAIDKDFFVNVFLMLIGDQRSGVTATEIAERKQEKVLMLGPILHRLDEEMLSPTLEIVFDIMYNNGLIEEPPAQIAGENLKVKYISILAQAQRAVGVEQVERVIGFIGTYAQVAPQMLDVINFDEVARGVAELEGIPQKMVNDKATVEAIQEQKAQQQQMAMAAEMANSAADTTKKLADSPMDEENALNSLSNTLAGR